MGTPCAVSLAELCLGYLEITNGLKPDTFRRYIDDACVRINKHKINTEIPELITFLDSLDPHISWTCDYEPNQHTTIFLDIVINNKTGSYSQYFKPTKRIDGFVPYFSRHQTHTLDNVPQNLYNRAITLNQKATDIKLAFTHLTTGLTALKFPLKTLRKATSQAKPIIPVRNKPKTLNPKKIIYLTVTNNNLNQINQLYGHLKHLNYILHLDSENALTKVTVKLSKRQPPSIAAQNNLDCTRHANNSPVQCPKANNCPLCRHILTDKTWTDFYGRVHFQARFSCKTRNLVYILYDENTNRALYVGHTGQTIGTRFYQHRKGKSSIRNTNFKLVALKSSPSKAKRLEHEKQLILHLKPEWNVQRKFHWWNSESHQSDAVHSDL